MNIKPLNSPANLIGLARRPPIDTDSSVTLLSIRQMSEHEVFGLSRHASPATIRRSCWPIGEDAAGRAELQAMRAATALDAASARALETNRERLDQMGDHFRKVVEGKVRFADPGFTADVMRPFVTWLRALRDLDKTTHASSGRCADELLSIVMSTKRELHVGGAVTEKHVSLSQLGATDGLAVNTEGYEMAAYFLEEIEPVLRDFHCVVQSSGRGSDILARSIGELRNAPVELSVGI